MKTGLYIKLAVLTVATCASTSGFGQATATEQMTLATARFAELNRGTRIIANGLDFSLVELDFSSGSPTGPALFASRTYFPTDVGHVFTATAVNEPGFNTFVSGLTDGKYEWVAWHVLDSQIASTEAGFFSSLPNGSNGIDFTGFRIDSVNLVFDRLTLTIPGSDPNHDGIWTDYSYSGSISIIGSPVPEPTAVTLILCGGFLLYWRKRSADSK